MQYIISVVNLEAMSFVVLFSVLCKCFPVTSISHHMAKVFPMQFALLPDADIVRSIIR